MVGKKSYQVAVRLSGTATSNWERIDGQYSGQGTDILTLPLARFLNVVYVWAMEHMSEEDAEKWEAELERPLPNQSDRNIAETEIAQMYQL